MAELKLRRSLLYVPGNMPSMLQNIPLFNCDAVQIDLEDAVPYSEKDAAAALRKLPPDVGVSDGIKLAMKSLT